MSFCTVTMSRGDRPELLNFCKHQLERMIVKPDRSYFIDYLPISEEIDLIERVKKGIELATKDGFDEVFIIEDDDFMPADYFTKMDLTGCDFIGQENTTYYNLRNRTWQTMYHPRRSSLFITGFRISALKNFVWPHNQERFLDISIWKYAQKFRAKYVQTKAVGIKHSMGLFAGRGHVMQMKNTDQNLEWLKNSTDNEAFIFYKQLMDSWK